MLYAGIPGHQESPICSHIEVNCIIRERDGLVNGPRSREKENDGDEDEAVRLL